jgi:hypothetical protein
MIKSSKGVLIHQQTAHLLEALDLDTRLYDGNIPMLSKMQEVSEPPSKKQKTEEKKSGSSTP